MSIYQHFRKEEHIFVDQVLGWKRDVERTYRYQLTDFLDPRDQEIVDAIIGQNHDELKVVTLGIHEELERKRIIIAPFYEPIEEEMFEVVLLSAKYASQFVKLSHRDVLGAFLSLGIVREKLGDILMEDDCIQIILDQQIAPYVQQQLTKIKHTTVTFQVEQWENLLSPEKNWECFEKIVSSMRLDVILKEIYRMSRKEALHSIQRKDVKVNFKIVDDPSTTVLEGDLLSVRGKGRSKVFQKLGYTRKNNIIIQAGILK